MVSATFSSSHLIILNGRARGTVPCGGEKLCAREQMLILIVSDRKSPCMLLDLTCAVLNAFHSNLAIGFVFVRR